MVVLRRFAHNHSSSSFSVEILPLKINVLDPKPFNSSLNVREL